MVGEEGFEPPSCRS